MSPYRKASDARTRPRAADAGSGAGWCTPKRIENTPIWGKRIKPLKSDLMTTVSIRKVLKLADALVRYPGCPVVLYHRESPGAQARKLEARTNEADLRIEEMGGTTVSLHSGVELGKLSATRPALLAAVDHAGALARHNKVVVILCAADLSRFIQSEAVHPKTNPKAEPTAEELARLFGMMPGGVILATLEDPTLSASELQSRKTKRGGKAGRPRELAHRIALYILERCLYRELVGGQIRYMDTSMAKLARRWGVTKSQIQRLLDSPGPDGRPLKECGNPASAYRKVHKLPKPPAP